MFERHPVPTPFPVEPVNVYVADRTIVDPGPETDEAWSVVRAALDEHGLEPADVERVLVTHPHPDHVGLARRFRDRGARVLASEETAAIVSAYADRLEYERAYFVEAFRRHGLAESVLESVFEFTVALSRYVSDCPVDRLLAEGSTVDVGRTTLTAEPVTGHAPGELCFAYEREGTRRALVGDHVLAGVTPNPLLQPPEEPTGDRPRVLPAFNASLARLRDRAFDRLLPGHGVAIDRPAERIDGILAAHEARTDAVSALVSEPTTAAEVMDGLFGPLPPTEAFAGMSEAIGHLDVLEERGLVRRRTDGENRITYEPV